ncbi:RNA polymerase sigma-B factor [Spinactinospora alkalitolerans]|uniref:RNA polymerase sigma-B factor n=1 Tax=Spinactinospora alkalitolerans TaxID=687207 RepID=A0A852TT77_9ACTN|nr:RNA polymerase sigma factor SigF [Spinactinospora alkalitolerans]NYE46715.1 RNA polymerase sigma-B factor [Spinactinospora alkalitolerans]
MTTLDTLSLPSATTTATREADGFSRVPVPSEAGAEEILAALADLPESSPAREALRSRIVQMHAPRVRRLADHYRNRGEPVDDLRQVAMLGLMKAIRGFDPDYGRPFVSYMLPMVTGELKRYFRDNTWAVRVPRVHQQRRSELNRTTMELTQRLGRSPKVREIADALELDVDATLELMDASAAYSALSLDAPQGEAEEEISLGDTIGERDGDLENVVDREALKHALTVLPARDRRMLLLRFFGNKTQSEIAATVGVSQMQVSRVLSKTLRRLREELAGGED